MDIFDIAIQMEKEGAVFYHELASKAPTKGFETIFTMLAEDEEKHLEVFTKLKAKSEAVMVTSKVAAKASSIIKGFKKVDFEKEKAQMQVYERALNVEKMSIEFYEAQLGNLETAGMRKTVAEILEEEKRHYSMIEELIKMLSRPSSWVENAEFGVREEY
jgi:rubrerythrin